MAAGSKLKNVTAEERRSTVSRLYLHGWKQADIAKKFGVTQQTISQDLATVREDWRRDAAEAISQRLAQELAKLAEMERELWTQWDSTHEPAIMGLMLRLTELRGRLTGTIRRDNKPSINVSSLPEDRVRIFLPHNKREPVAKYHEQPVEGTTPRP